MAVHVPERPAIALWRRVAGRTHPAPLPPFLVLAGLEGELVHATRDAQKAHAQLDKEKKRTARLTATLEAERLAAAAALDVVQACLGVEIGDAEASAASGSSGPSAGEGYLEIVVRLLGVELAAADGTAGALEHTLTLTRMALTEARGAAEAAERARRAAEARMAASDAARAAAETAAAESANRYTIMLHEGAQSMLLDEDAPPLDPAIAKRLERSATANWNPCRRGPEPERAPASPRQPRRALMNVLKPQTSPS